MGRGFTEEKRKGGCFFKSKRENKRWMKLSFCWWVAFNCLTRSAESVLGCWRHSPSSQGPFLRIQVHWGERNSARGYFIMKIPSWSLSLENPLQEPFVTWRSEASLFYYRQTNFITRDPFFISGAIPQGKCSPHKKEAFKATIALKHRFKWMGGTISWF